MAVEDHFAGQTGPCAACGRPITIPTPSGAPGTATGSGALGVLGVVLGVAVVSLVLCVGLVGLIYALMVPAVGRARAGADRTTSMNNMKQIMLALHNYHDVHGSLPPAYVTDADGKPLYSWRVLVLPFMEQSNLYERFDKSKAWDDPANIAISDTMIPLFQSPCDPNVASNGTSYVCVVGPNTMFPGEKSRQFREVIDGLSNTIMIVEVKDIPGSWAAPIDPRVDQIQPVVGDLPNQLHPAQPQGVLVGFADGAARYLERDAPARVVQPAAFNVNDGQWNPVE